MEAPLGVEMRRLALQTQAAAVVEHTLVVLVVQVAQAS
jgi:hypothetical protein